MLLGAQVGRRVKTALREEIRAYLCHVGLIGEVCAVAHPIGKPDATQHHRQPPQRRKIQGEQLSLASGMLAECTTG